MPSIKTFEECLADPNSRKIWAIEATLKQPGVPVLSKEIRYSDQSIHPDMRSGGKYKSRLKEVAYYRQRMQEVFTGLSQRSFGEFHIWNPDGELDDLVTDWIWSGNPVVCKLGFPELDTVDFKPMFTARMGLPKRKDDDYIAVPVMDYQQDFYNHEYTVAYTQDTVANHVDAILTDVGGITKDTTLWSAWAAENNFNIYFGATGEKASRCLDRILAPFACWYDFDRENKFRVGTFKAPDLSTPELVLADNKEILEGGYHCDELIQYWEVIIEYISATPSTYSQVSRNDSSILDTGIPKKTLKRRTLLRSSTDAQTIRDRWWDLRSVPRRKTKLETFTRPFTLKQHDQLALSAPRYSLGGDNQRIIGFTIKPAKDTVTLETFS
jgi:hypothetical protein